MQMDQFEAARVLHERIKSFEPEDVLKIVGYIYMQNYPKHEMIRLAMGPDELIHKLIDKVKMEVSLYSRPSLTPSISPCISPSPISDPSVQFGPFSPASPLPHSSPVAFGMCGPYLKRAGVCALQPVRMFDVLPVAYPGALREEPGFHNHLTSKVQPEQINYQSYDFSGDFFINGGSEGNTNSVKICHYFNKGFCKHGGNCRYFHSQQFPDNCLQGGGFYSSESGFEDHVISPSSLEKLEVEITELLKSRRGNPVSIASLPMMYYEKYGRTLQAEGYLTESQRHGKAGFSLTMLLARLRNILLIDRPHGQHSVILAEDAPKYMELHGERNDPDPIVCGSRQIYLTFPAESSFTEEDVCDYFNTFGPVQDVRIPRQQKRMFGFVTFASADTVKMILSRGNPHYICGARVLVKPYREKSKLVERKYQEQFEYPMCFQLDEIDMDHERHARWSVRLQQEQLMKEHEHALELEARRLSQLYLAKKPLPIQSCFGRSLEDLKLSDDCSKYPLAESSLYPCDDELKKRCSKYADPDRNDGHNLPDSPFGMPLANSIPSI